MKALKHSVWGLMVLILSGGCSKDKPDPPCDDNGLPCLTHEGKNTFGCRINGAIFIPKTKASIGGTVALNYLYNESTYRFLIEANRDDTNDNIENLAFTVYILNGVDNYEMDVAGSSQEGYIYYGADECIYYHNIDNPGSVNITYFNETERIISGTFSMELINPACTDGTTMNITDGRFDVRF